ncbi:SPOR domain-containing protein [Phaeobacter sp.]|uniref:SPOR domain-containing protein n=1 Tax=Phaeobacter sp. TaxID=1902409 RepID=UPI0025CE64F1|nr:SPOR domain-containing protein [Phaeobacter sp.]
MVHATPPRTPAIRLMVALSALTVMAACADSTPLAFLTPKDKAADAVEPSSSTRLVEREIEAPEVFQVTESGLWDGRPSLGGVWVAHPDAKDPEQVIIRNQANGKFVIGALFRRERDIPGPRLQVSSDAAEALEMLAGAPVELNVTALRRETVPEPTISGATQDSPLAPATDLDVAANAPADIAATPLDPIAGAAAAIEAAGDTAAASGASASSLVSAQPDTRALAARSSLSKPFIQIGIFSIEANATRTADQMRSAGLIPTVLAQSSNGKPFWRVVVGPAQSQSERSQLLATVKEVGFSDAYAVTN